MKKGDIVRLKDSRDTLSDLYYTTGSDRSDLIEFKGRKEFPTELTVKSTGSISLCCTDYPTVRFEEIEGVTFSADYFTVVLEAGEPDVAKLLEESKQMEKAWIGM